MKVVILCGGRGLRLMPHTASCPKPMVLVGGQPLLWHIMQGYAKQGHRDFVLLTGYRSDVIENWQKHLMLRQPVIQLFTSGLEWDWKIQCVDTGEDTATGGRLLRAREVIGDGRFMLTYGDGLADVDLSKLVSWHVMGRDPLCTVTTVNPRLPFGVATVGELGKVAAFSEKPVARCIDANAGFFVMEPAIFGKLDDGPLEHKLGELAGTNNVYAYRHHGFFKAVDTHQDLQDVRAIWDRGDAPWAK
ncbi:MAG: glucose-1-phosphate cytidylyltransferase [Patescibacteria group bacterium]|nr:glucose-1-phosphate cytidylyltransferase [Patescibacteria group bacterium]